MKNTLDPGEEGPVAGSRFLQNTFQFRPIFNLLCWEGVLAVIFDSWLGTTYLSGLAGELNIDLKVLTFLAAMPWMGGIAQILGAFIFKKLRSARTLTILTIGGARILWAIPISLALFWGYQSYFLGALFPVQKWFNIMVLCACLSAILASTGGMAWMAWMKGIVPSRFRGRFFGYRQRFTTIAFVLVNVTASRWIGWKPGGYQVGYGMLGVIALLAGIVSTMMLFKIPARDLRSKVADCEEDVPQGSLLSDFKEALGNSNFRLLLLFGALFNGALQLASGYYPYYFTKELHISMGLVAIWVAITNAGSFFAVAFWGRKIDRTQSPSAILWLTGLIVAIEPLFYMSPSTQFIKLIAPFDYFLNGLVWSGFSLAQTSLLFQVTPRNKSPSYFALYSASSGVAGLIGTFLGGQLIEWLSPFGKFRGLWVTASVLRLIVLFTFGRKMLRSFLPEGQPSIEPKLVKPEWVESES